MFQDANVAKSMPFALLTKYQKSLYPPKVFKIAPILANYAKFADHFSFKQREIEPSNFTANCVKIAQFATPNNESREIRVILVKSY